MILATWNIRAGHPLEHAAKLRTWCDADVIALQECCEPAPLDQHVAWTGAVRHKGLAVVTRDGLQARAWPAAHTADCLPVDIESPATFVFVGAWTHRTTGQTYPECLRNALRTHLPALVGRDVVVAGDFNSHPAFDQTTRRFTHADLMQWLYDELGLVSAWHAFRGEAIGAESRPTYYHRFKQADPFHIDYVCVPQRWLPKIARVEISEYDGWQTSDHRPITVEIRM